MTQAYAAHDEMSNSNRVRILFRGEWNCAAHPGVYIAYPWLSGIWRTYATFMGYENLNRSRVASRSQPLMIDYCLSPIDELLVSRSEYVVSVLPPIYTSVLVSTT